MPAPLISVVMPVRAVRNFTYQAINSIIEQSHDALELLVVGQPEQRSPLAHHYTDKRIRWLCREAPGIVHALNTGLAAARGSYIARMDDDDIAHPDRLAAQLEHIQQHSLDICGTRIKFFNDNNNVGDGNQRYAAWLNGLTHPQSINRSVFVECPIPHPTFFASADTWQRVGGYRNCAWPEDYDFILRAWQLGLTMGKPEPVLLNWREHPGRLTYSDKRYSRQSFVNAKAAALCSATSRVELKAREIWIAGTGRNARYWFDALQQHNISVNGFVDLPHAKMKTSKRNRPVISYTTFWKNKSNSFLIIALGNDDARKQCINWCVTAGLSEMTDFIAG